MSHNPTPSMNPVVSTHTDAHLRRLWRIRIALTPSPSETASDLANGQSAHYLATERPYRDEPGVEIREGGEGQKGKKGTSNKLGHSRSLKVRKLTRGKRALLWEPITRGNLMERRNIWTVCSGAYHGCQCTSHTQRHVHRHFWLHHRHVTKALVSKIAF